MPTQCVNCGTEIEDGLLCEHCAPLVVETLRLSKKERARVAREARKPSYNEYARRVPLRPVTVPPVAFGKREGT